MRSHHKGSDGLGLGDGFALFLFSFPDRDKSLPSKEKSSVKGYHGLSHHGNDPDKIAEFNQVGKKQVTNFARFIRLQ